VIGLDTNVLVRYLVQDDRIQSARVTAFIEQTLTEAEPGFVSLVAMVETVWVLDRAYGLSDSEIVSTVERLLETAELVVEREQTVFAAMAALAADQASFADALIAALGAKAGCTHTVTFDQKALRLPDVKLL
jgi:predicted nucleic-acid-binding protein